jgi:triacylglycerol lipase
MKLLAGILLLLFLSPVSGSRTIFELHGYAASKMIMKKIDRNLKKENFRTFNYGYKSRRIDLDSLGEELYHTVRETGTDTVSFVTHSMGALVVRSMLQYSQNDKAFPVIDKMVMIAPPNRGAEIADYYSSVRMLHKFLGPNIHHMTTDSGSYAGKLPKPCNPEVGIIIGLRGRKHGYNPFIQGDNDGRLTPERTRLGIEKDLVVIKSGHHALARKKAVCILVSEFLRSGQFLSKQDFGYRPEAEQKPVNN